MLNTAALAGCRLRPVLYKPIHPKPSSLDLSLARTGDGTVGAASRRSVAVRLGVSVGLAVAVAVAVGGRHLELGHIDDSLATSVAAGTSALGSLVVGGDVEGDEQEEVGGDDSNSGESGELFSGTHTHVGCPGEVGG